MAETNLSVEEQIRTAISQYDEQAKSRAEELQAAISRCEKLEAIFAQKEAEQAKNVRESLEGNTISKPRNLVVCIDGTSYELRTQGFTNVMQLYNMLVKDDRQLTFYSTGIGTYAKSLSWGDFGQMRRLTAERMFGRNIGKIIQESYQWLSENYRDGDRIFLFGFSRGAYQVRCLSAMIDTVGLIHRGNPGQTAFAYEVYAATAGKRTTSKPMLKRIKKKLKSGLSKLARLIPNEDGSSFDTSSSQEFSDAIAFKDDPIEQASSFKESFSRNVWVYFVGAWDTVSSIRGKSLPAATSGMRHAEYFRHALALDERRVKFLPEYMFKGSSMQDDRTELDLQYRLRHTKEVWFAGTHSDIGGPDLNRPPQEIERQCSDPPLRWMCYEALVAGLRLHSDKRHWPAKQDIVFRESLTGFWKILEWMPVRHLTYDDERTAKRRAHRGRGRYLRPGQMLHSSIIGGVERDNDQYIPKASLEKAQNGWFRVGRRGPTSWNQLLKPEYPLPDFVEPDIYDHLLQLVDDLFINYKINKILDVVDHVNKLVTLIVNFVDGDTLRKVLKINNLLPRDVQAYLIQTCSPYPVTKDTPSSIATSSSGQHTAMVKSLGETIHVSKVSTEGNPSQWMKILKGHVGAVTSLAITADGSHVVSGGYDRTVRLWNIDTSHDRVLAVHDDIVGSVVFSAGGNLVASGSQDGTIMIFQDATGEVIETPHLGHASSITSLAFSSDNTVLASGSSDCTIRIWKVSNGSKDLQTQPMHVFEGHTAAIIALTFSPNNHLLASGSYDSTVRIWKAIDMSIPARVLDEHPGCTMALAFSSDGERIISGSTDYLFRLWDAQTGRALTSPISYRYTGRDELDNWLSSVRFSTDEKRIIAVSARGAIYSRDIVILEKSPGCLYPYTHTIWAVAFSPDSKRLICSGDHIIKVWDVQTGEQALRPLQGHTRTVTTVQFSPDGSLIASGSADETIRIWEALTGKQKGEPLRGHRDGVNSVGFSPDGKHLVSGSHDHTICIWNLDTMSKAFKVLEGHRDWVSSVQYSPDGRCIASGSADRTIRLWNAKTGKEIGQPFRGHSTQVTSVAFSPDGTRIVSGSGDSRQIRIWDAKTGEEVGQPEVVQPWIGHTKLVRSVAYSPDGERIISGSDDSTVCVWGAETGIDVLKLWLQGHTDSVWSVAFSPDGRIIASASYDKTIRLWDANTGEPIRF